MTHKQYSEHEILDVLAQVEAGTAVGDVAKLSGVSQATIHRWQARYGGMTKDDAKRVRQLEQEHRRLKTLVADLTLDNSIPKEVPRQNVGNPDQSPQAQTPVKRRVIWDVRHLFGSSERRACRVLDVHRSTQRHRSTTDDREPADKRRTRTRERPRFGYRRLHILLRRQGENVNHKRVYRVYRDEGLAVCNKTRRTGVAQTRLPSHVADTGQRALEPGRRQ